MSAPTWRRRVRSDEEKRLLAAAARLLPTGVRNPSVSPEYAFVVRHARGARITDWSGNEYVDYLLGSGPMLLGHAHPAVVAAVAQSLDRGASYLMVSEPTIRLAEELVAIVPCAEAVSFHSTGTEAVFFALRLARAWRRRDKVLKFEGAFHGMSDYALMSNQWTRTPAEWPAPVPNSTGIPAAVAADVLVAPFNDLERTTAIIERHHDELAAVVVEPLQRTIPPRPGFLEGLRQATTHYGIALVFDEVVTGFRLALGGAQERYGVVPDLCALGKSISAGHPLGVLCGRREIMMLADPERREVGDAVQLTGTYSANPISAVAALACLAELRRPGVFKRLEATGRRLMHALTEALRGARVPAQVLGEPSVFQPWFTETEVVDHRSSLTADARRGLRFVDCLLDRGVLKAHEKFFVSTAHGEDEAAVTIAAFEAAAERLGGTFGDGPQ
jgi:glutamate-1-semialdehyde 2,1-aminomutase